MLYKAVEQLSGNKDLALSLRTTVREGVAVLHCAGRIHLRAEAELFAAAARQAFDSGVDLILDVSGVQSIDSAGLGELVMVYMQGRGAERQVRLAGPDNFVRSLLELTNVGSLFEIHPTVEEALASIVQTVNS
jgi:anti-sigma B factor antagonist